MTDVDSHDHHHHHHDPRDPYLDDTEMAALLTDIEWEYTGGRSFGDGDENVLRWLNAHGWAILRPVGYRRTPPEALTATGLP